ncbi:MAG: oligosaccharide flippase family protein [Bacteroidia bacterium]|nr:oligosaccharide flippase family protein [Bacteroidia bacterium]
MIKLIVGLSTKIFKSNHFILLLGNALVAALGFLSFIYLARMLSKEIFGAWVIYLTAFNFMEMLRAGAIHQALVRNLAAATSPEEQQAIVGASWRLGILISLVLSVILLGLASLERIWAYSSGWQLFLRWYPLTAWISLPLSMTLWIQHARERFRWMASINLSVNLLFLAALLLISHQVLSLSLLFLLHAASRLLVSGGLLVSDWAEGSSIFKTNWQALRKQWAFGRFSFLTLIGTNLLQSADILLISIFLGEKAAATYALPLKLIEVVALPLRSMAMVAFPRFSRLYSAQQRVPLLRSFKSYSMGYTLVLLPFLALAGVFSETIIRYLGGEAYTDGIWVLNIFLVFILFLPLDRFSGILLDSIHAPQINSVKVLVMAGINIVGDAIVLYFFQNLWAVALITILNVLFGLVIALFYIVKKLDLPNWRYLLSPGLHSSLEAG